jgi:hypothetical protein
VALKVNLFGFARPNPQLEHRPVAVPSGLLDVVAPVYARAEHPAI